MYLFINNLSDEHKTFLALIADQTSKIIASVDLMKKDNKSENILDGIDRLLVKAGEKEKNLIGPWPISRGLKGVIVVNGPGSFVGIRVALSVANTIAWTNNIPAVGVKLEEGKDNETLIKKGLQQLKKAKKNDMAVPFYGKEPNITMKN
ncbi:hypothetical protein MYX07_03585 [Patescibacteria group bacterium AH-259-L07]|nr:hypothetical protein [Patescibacteria group bacterium AH-259-L07]